MDTRIALSVPDQLIAAVDEWRRVQPDIPGRSEAIRRLIELGVAFDALLNSSEVQGSDLPSINPRGDIDEDQAQVLDFILETITDHRDRQSNGPSSSWNSPVTSDVLRRPLTRLMSVSSDLVGVRTPQDPPDPNRPRQPTPKRPKK